MERFIRPDFSSELFALTAELLTVPKTDCEAIAIFPGQGQLERYSAGIALWNSNPHVRALYIAGENTREKNAFALTHENLVSVFGLERVQNVHLGVHADHTLAQAEWLCDYLEKHEVKSCVLVTAPFFMPRAFLTLVKSLMKRGLGTLIVPWVARIAPGSVVPEQGRPSWELYAGEAARIATYQEKGDVASYDEAKKYINRFWSL